MKTKTAKQPKQSKPAVRLKDIKPKKNPKGGDTSQGGSTFQIYYQARLGQ